MSLRINFNSASLSAQRALSRTQDDYARSAQRISTGKRINSAADDAAGLAVSTKLKAQISGLNQAQKNVQDGINAIAISEGALSQMHALLSRMRELAVQSATATVTDSDRAQSNAEFTALSAEIDRLGTSTAYASIKLLDGSATAFQLQVGANGADTMTVEFPDARVSGIDSPVTPTASPITNAAPGLAAATITDLTSANGAIATLDGAIEVISAYRASLGSMSNRLETTSDNLATAMENVSAANSRIEDADIASEMSELVRTQILQQAGIAILSQANQAPQSVLKLLQ
ncbi:MAG: flagellin FliC [Proteobacteria bacterium]|nr:flagellin FliC [Pseudomonadota bacterium]